MNPFHELNPPLTAKERKEYIETLRACFSIIRAQNNLRGPDVEVSAVDFARKMVEAYHKLEEKNKMTMRLYCWPISDESGRETFLTIKDVSEQMGISERTGERWITQAIEAHRENFANLLVNHDFKKLRLI